MALTKESLRQDIKAIIGDFPMFTGDNELGDTEIELAMEQGLKRLERDRPKCVIVDLTGDGGNYYPLTSAGGFSDWENFFSRITDIDWNAEDRVTDNSLPQFLSSDDGDYKLYQRATATFELWIKSAPSSSVVVRVYHTGRYDLDASLANQDIPVEYEEALTYISIYQFLLSVEMYMAKGTDGAVGVQHANFQGPVAIINRVMERYLDRYKNELGIEDNSIEPAAVDRDFDLDYLGGEEYLFHQGSLR